MKTKKQTDMSSKTEPDHLVDVDLTGIDCDYRSADPILARMHQEADLIQKYLEEDVDISDAAALPPRLAKLDGYLHRMSDMQARAKAMKEYARMTYLSQNERALSQMTATNSNRIINAALHEFTVAADRLDALHSSLTHACRNISIQLSWIKKTMDLGG